LARFFCNLEHFINSGRKFPAAIILLSNRGLVKPNRFTQSFLLVAMFSAFMAFHPAAQAQEPPVNAEVEVGYQPGLAPGDQIEIIAPDLTETTDIKLTIGPEGTIFFPYVGVIKMAGLSPDQAQLAIVKALQDKQIVNDPQITINVVAARNYAVYVVGEVKSPSRIPVFSAVPLSMILTASGGFTTNASLHVLITHADGSAPIDVDVSRDLHDLHTLNAKVLPGDMVAVVPAGTYFALGEFNKPGAFPIVGTQHMTLLQAIAAAGGPTPYAGLSKCRVLRSVNGHREEIMFDLLKLQRGEIADPLLHTDDIIYAPRNNSKPVINNWLSTTLTLTSLGLSLATFLK
jgi:polysaccharide export outer membrane protein